MISIIQNETFLKLKKCCCDYCRNLVDITTRAILLVVCTAVLNMLVLYFYNILWHIYRLTHIGRQFVILHPGPTQMLSAILGDNIAGLSMHATLAAFTICMTTSALCQVFYFSRFFYQSRRSIGKLALWGLPLTAVVSMYVNIQHGFNHWAAVIPVTIVPTLCVFTYSFKFSARLLPEIGDVITSIFRFFKIIVFLTASQPR